MEGFHRVAERVVVNQMIRGVSVGVSALHRELGIQRSVNITRLLHNFFLMFGLKLNMNKSSIYGVRVECEKVQSITSINGCNTGKLLFTYIGLPIGSKMSRKSS